jgi:membrane protease YdiL (CAAX protease family)
MLYAILEYFLGWVVGKWFGFGLAEIVDFKEGDDLFLGQNILRVRQLTLAIALVATAFLVSMYLKVHHFDMYKLEFGPKLKITGITLAVVLFSVPLVAYLLELNSNLPLGEEMKEQFTEIEAQSERLYELLLFRNNGFQMWANLFFMALVPAVAEELFFRGALQRIFAGYFKNNHIGIIVSSALFTLIHLQPYKVIPMLVLALGLGYLYYLTNNLWYPILAHFLNNSLAVFADHWEKQGSLPTGLETVDQGNLALALISIAALTGLYYLLNKASKERLDHKLIPVSKPGANE